MLRIIAGKHRSRRLEMPQSEAVRPTMDRVREALFSSLSHHLGSFEGARVLDVCCGSGAAGLEAISRGAGFAVFMDSSSEALALARRNAQTLREQEQCRFVQANILTPPAADAPCDLILMDAPYDQGLSDKGFAALLNAGWATPAALAAIEVGRDEPFLSPAGWSVLLERAYGPARLVLLSRG